MRQTLDAVGFYPVQKQQVWKNSRIASSRKCQTNVLKGRIALSPASASSGGFIHIEQDPGFRTADDGIDAVSDTFPPSAP
jgi:hypothetical protein